MTMVNGGVAEYVRRISESSPSEAVQIALAEAEREKAIAAQARTEYLAMAEVKFARDGSIADANLAGLYRLAEMYSRTEMVPQQYRGRPSDCFIACQMAYRLGIDPLAYMQASYVVHGKPGIEAKLAIALLNKSGKIKGRLRWRYEGEGPTRKCTAYAVDAESGDTVESPVDWVMVKAEGWDKKSGSKWITMPDIMFGYRSAAFLIRQYYPEVLMGISTTDELNDEPAPRQEIQSRVSTIDGLMGRWNSERTVEAGQAPKLPEPQPEPRDGGVTGGGSDKSPGDPPGVSHDSAAAAPPAAPRIDWRALEMDLDNAHTLLAVSEVEGAYLPDANELERTRLLDACEARRKEIRGKRGAGSKAPAEAAT